MKVERIGYLIELINSRENWKRIKSIIEQEKDLLQLHQYEKWINMIDEAIKETEDDVREVVKHEKR